VLEQLIARQGETINYQQSQDNVFKYLQLMEN